MKINKTFFCLNISILLSSSALFGMVLPDLEETPIGFYKKLKPIYQVGGREREESFSITRQMSPAKDQNPLGTCVSFAASACAEYYYPTERFSEAEITILAETRPSAPAADCKSGLFLGNTLTVGQQWGFVTEARLQYPRYLRYVAGSNGIDTRDRSWVDQLAEKERTVKADICLRRDYNGTMRRIGALELGDGFEPFGINGTASDISPYRFGRLDPIHHVSRSSISTALSTRRYSEREASHGVPTRTNLEAIKSALSNGCPVAVALNVYDISDLWNPTSSEPYVKMPDLERIDEPGYLSGSHAIVLTGFDDAAITDSAVPGAFTFKNSWGPRWGRKGFTAIPYDYMGLFATEVVAVYRPS
ncbi:MAG: C1 family peptidase [Proteobacteria bacterium]|nr:C1 family peptidase [Pseudomonadota bacterium]